MENIIITNFGKFGSNALDVSESPVCLFGENGAGKTTLLKAVTYLLTGKYGIPDPKDGNDSSVTLKTDTMELSRIRHKSGKGYGNVTRKNGKQISAEQFEEELAKIYGPSKTLLSVDFDNGLTDFFKSAIPERFEKSEILARMGQLPERFENLVTGDSLSMNELKKLYNRVKEERLAYDRLIKTQDAKIHRELLDQAASEKDLKVLEEGIAELQKEFGRMEQYQRSKKTYEAAAKNAAACEKRRKELEAQLKRMANVLDHSNSIQALRGSINVQKQAIAKQQAEGSEMKKKINALKAFADNLNEPSCPLVKGVVCKQDWTPKKEELQKIVSDLTATAWKLVGTIRDEMKQVKEQETNLAAHEQQQKLFEKKKAYKQELDNLPKPVEPPKLSSEELPDPDVLKKTLEDKQVMLKNLQEIIRNKQLAKKNDELKKERGLWKAAEDALNPKTGTVMTGIYSEYIAPIEAELQETLKEVKPNMKIRLVVSGGVTVEANTGFGWISYNQLSSGEKADVVLALTLVTSQLSGSRVYLFDNVEQMDAETLKKFGTIEFPENSLVLIAGVDFAEVKEAFPKETTAAVSRAS